MLQNRVDPFGDIIKTSARGAWIGNRGVIHNDRKEITHAFKHKAWITCALEFKNRKRTVMSPNRWTELFFLDEATAFAAGHRPCFECRREDATKFKRAWIEGNPTYKLDMSTSIRAIDAIIHGERIGANGTKVIHSGLLSEIPEGTFLQIDKHAYVWRKGFLWQWTPFGYKESISLPAASKMSVLTPLSIVNAFRAGYVPEMSKLLSDDCNTTQLNSYTINAC